MDLLLLAHFWPVSFFLLQSLKVRLTYKCKQVSQTKIRRGSARTSRMSTGSVTFEFFQEIVVRSFEVVWIFVMALRAKVIEYPYFFHTEI